MNILAGGFPCQDVSLAGRRRGMKEGTRSGLWTEFARIIDTVRPDWVVIENVRGLLSADAAGTVEPCPLCVGDNPEHVLRALGAVLGDLAELGFDAEWTGLRASDVGAPHGRFRVFILAWPATHARDATDDREWARTRSRLGGAAALDAAGLTGGRGSDTRTSDRRSGGEANVMLLPTPTVTNQHTNEYNGRGELLLPGVVQLLPTPGAYDGERGGSQHPDKRRGGGHSVTLQDVAEHALLPTPTARLGQSRGASSPERRKELNAKRSGELDEVAVHSIQMMPTPRASRGGSATETMYALGAKRVDDERAQGQVVGDITDWGPYEAAIRRWERVTGRPAPAPVRHDGKGGKPRLNPELTEWMMGWPAGWVTAPAIGLTRAEQLKACGNGVVPQQAAAALRIMLARPGVPTTEGRSHAERSTLVHDLPE